MMGRHHQLLHHQQQPRYHHHHQQQNRWRGGGGGGGCGATTSSSRSSSGPVKLRYCYDARDADVFSATVVFFELRRGYAPMKGTHCAEKGHPRYDALYAMMLGPKTPTATTAAAAAAAEVERETWRRVWAVHDGMLRRHCPRGNCEAEKAWCLRLRLLEGRRKRNTGKQEGAEGEGEGEGEREGEGEGEGEGEDGEGEDEEGEDAYALTPGERTLFESVFQRDPAARPTAAELLDTATELLQQARVARRRPARGITPAITTTAQDGNAAAAAAAAAASAAR
jgi:hypothetical protein